MSIFTGSIRFRRYQVMGGKVGDDPLARSKEKLENLAFRPLTLEDERTQAIGWVSAEDLFDWDVFLSKVLFERMVAMTLRVDEIKIPSKILAHECKKQEEDWKAKYQREKLSRAERDDIKALVTKNLAKKVLPNIKAVDVLWDMEKNEVLFFSSSSTMNDTFLELFEKTFDLTLRPLFPYSLAVKNLDEAGMKVADRVVESDFAQREDA